MLQKIKTRKHLNAESLIEQLRDNFEKIPDYRAKNTKYSLPDALISAYAVFSLKCPSLLEFEKKREDAVEWENIKSVFRVEDVPCDSQMRNIIDEVDSEKLRPAFTKIFAQLQRGKVLEHMTYFEDYYLLSIDGIEVYHSEKIFSKNCLSRKLKDGSIEYYEQFLGAVIVHPERKEVIPLCPEMIIKQDGNEKNDCERNASKRFLKEYRREHPHLKTIVIEDALGANAPHIKELQKYNCRYIIGVKPKGNKFLFDYVQKAQEENSNVVVEFEIEEKVTLNPAGRKRKIPKTVTHKFRFMNNIPLNESNKDVNVNFLEYWEIDEQADTIKHFSWTTDIEVTKENSYQLMRSGRARWKIENETFNTLTNQGYNLKHNYGLGKKNLSINFILLMMLAFLVDQIQQLCCPLFQAALEKVGGKKYLWSGIRSLFSRFEIDSFTTMLEAIAYGIKAKRPEFLYK
jgi:hypothetical protein